MRAIESGNVFSKSKDDYEKSPYFGIFEDLDYFRISANSAGLENFAAKLMEAAHEAKKGDDQEIRAVNLLEDWVDQKSHVVLGYVEPLHQRPVSNRREEEATLVESIWQNKQSGLVAMLFLLGLLTFAAIGLITVIKWVF